jgi:hypothetical protein
LKNEWINKYFSLFFQGCEKVRDGFVAILMIVAYHCYDGICYAVSNLLGYFQAILIMSALLLFLSVVFVYLHEFLFVTYSWDMLGLQHLNDLKYEMQIPQHRIFKRLLKKVMIGGYWWIYFVGPLIIGPHVVTILLRRGNKLSQNLTYIIPGTLLSAVFWVSMWAGVGFLTWDRLVKPLWERAF